MRKYVLYGSLALMVVSAASSMQPRAAARESASVAEPAAVNCELAALMPDAPLRLDECKALVDLYLTLAQVDPTGGRDGDEQMNCADLRSELARVDGPARLDDRFRHSIAAVAREISESVRANPRLGRLLQLAAALGCTADDDGD